MCAKASRLDDSLWPSNILLRVIDLWLHDFLVFDLGDVVLTDIFGNVGTGRYGGFVSKDRRFVLALDRVIRIGVLFVRNCWSGSFGFNQTRTFGYVDVLMVVFLQFLNFLCDSLDFIFLFDISSFDGSLRVVIGL